MEVVNELDRWRWDSRLKGSTAAAELGALVTITGGGTGLLEEAAGEVWREDPGDVDLDMVSPA